MKRLACPATLLALVIAALAWWRLAAAPPLGAAPRPPAGVALDPMVAAAVAAALERVRGAPDSASARGELAMVYHANGLPGLAEETYAQALAAEPDAAPLWYQLGRARAALGLHAAALAAMDEAARREPAYVPAHWQRGFLLLELGRLDEADLAFARALALRPGEPAALVGLARVRLLRADPQGAAALLEPLLAQFPGTGYLHQLLGNALQQMGRFPDAARHLARADGRVPGWHDPWSGAVEERRSGLGPLLERATDRAVAGDTAGALRLVEPLRASHSQEPLVLAKLGEIHLTRGELDRARECFEAVLEREPDHVFAHVYLARVHRRGGRPAEAARHAAHAARLHADWAPAWIEVAGAAADEGRWTDAQGALRRALELGGADGSVLLLLGTALHQGHQDEEAAAVLEDVLAREPDHVPALALLARVHARRGRVDLARAALERAARLAPQDPSVRAAAALLERAGGGP
jgi:tetratricopeptide (TPR) repeat protein